ncbi:F-box protein [Cardamine amara subsp. amara]|uniref:F-box protein n=1 Tax=Cardamine amara subsp. amara TaxID=228776 RepID=A0ABD1A4I1_CARAN
MASPAAPVHAVTGLDPKRNRQCWSNLPPDLLHLVFERLGFTDLERAKCVCTSWQYASRKSQPNNHIPWLILFPKNHNNCLLFNLEEQEKLLATTLQTAFVWRLIEAGF